MTRVTFLAIAALLAAYGPARAKDPAVGEPAPAFDGKTFNDEKVSLADLRGNVVILNFWATWCGPCKEELPLLDAYQKHSKGYGLRVVAVTTDAENFRTRDIKNFQEKLAISLLKRFHGDYGPIRRAIPTNYVIDRAGVLRYAASGAFNLDSLNELLVPLLQEAPPPDIPMEKAVPALTDKPTETAPAIPPN